MTFVRKTALALSAATIVGLAAIGTGYAQIDHSGMNMSGMAAPAADSAATEAYKAAMDKMHETMTSMEYSGNADVDFARSMIPHHQAAIDMAKVQLENGKNPEMRKLAEEVIAAQEAEIKRMEAWLQANPPM
ncbi:CopM family metallochaperone [Aminobacter sp. Piv2-1]|uniref:CopM family metallochaperone n=1 Tax=Aminobacter sp. Piv2-1 TaxID=3031122 RepID=UPI0030A7DC69